MQLHHNPQYKNKNLLNIKDKNDKYFIQNIINVAKNKKEGHVKYSIEKPNENGSVYSKYSYVKYFAPLDLIIGTGEYLDNVEHNTREKVLKWVEHVRFDTDGYIFIISGDGISLANPDKLLVGKNIINLTDKNGVKIVQELIKISKQSKEEFATYFWPKLSNKKLSNKLSYVRYFPKWNWVIGAGIYIEDIEKIFVKKNIQIKAKFQNQIIFTIIIFIVTTGIAIISSYFFFKKVNDEIYTLTDFLQNSTTNDNLLNIEKFKILDFISLVNTANKMIIKRRIAEKALMETEKRYKILFENTDDGIFMIDDGKFVDCNRSIIKMLGCKNKVDLLDSHFAKISPEKQADGRYSYEKSESMMALAIKKGTYNFEWIHKRFDGTIFPVEISLTAVTCNKRYIMYGSIRDITQRQEKFVKLEDTLSNLVKFDQEKNEILAIIARDLKNPLSVIKGYAEEIEEYYDEIPLEEIIQYVGLIKEGSHNMVDLITNLLDVNQIETGNINISSKKTDLLPIVKNIVSNYMEKAKSKNIVFQTGELFALDKQGNREGWFNAYVDPKTVEDILEKVISNAIKYSKIDKNIYIYLIESENFISCNIKDEGFGLTPKDQKKLFKKFSRLNSKSKNGEESIGLGLFIAEKLIQAMNGSISCESKFGVGSTFVIKFPKNND
jgi:PAS domain S-box-containing protein